MFQAIKSLVADLASGGPSAGSFEGNDYRLAFAALLMHAAAVDGDFSKAERDSLVALLKRRFELDVSHAHELVEQATAAERGSGGA